MQVTEVRLTQALDQDNCLAYGSVTFDGDFVVCGIRVLRKNKDGDLFVGFPSRKNQKGEYKDICFPMNADLRENISVAVIAEYEKLVTVQNPLGELINFCTKQRIFKTCFAILFR